MKPITVFLPGNREHTLTRLLSKANHKQEKDLEHLSVGLTLTPRATGRAGRNLCPFATCGCAASCFADYDRMAWPQNKQVAVARTHLLTQEPALFRRMLTNELHRELARANKLRMPLVCRLNVVSDVAFEREFLGFFEEFAAVQFMDYTKYVSRVLGSLPPNYHLTFSRSERNEADCRRVLEAGKNVTVIFRKPPFPESFWGFPVIDGDKNDLRFLDPSPCVVGLKAKGKGARDDRTGFVVDHPPKSIALLSVADHVETVRSTPARRGLETLGAETIPFLRSIAAAYHALPQGRTGDRAAEKSYEAFRREVIEQHSALPVRVERWAGVGQPYANSHAMFADVQKSGRLFVFTGGEDHPYLSRDENEMFRAVHDYYGHYIGRFQFGPIGEVNAWLAHCRMFSEQARPALTCETLAVSCWFFFGPFSHLPAAERPYADQKASLLPEKLWHPLLIAHRSEDATFSSLFPLSSVKSKQTMALVEVEVPS